MLTSKQRAILRGKANTMDPFSLWARARSTRP